jgi:hypothetical protein
MMGLQGYGGQCAVICQADALVPAPLGVLFVETMHRHSRRSFIVASEVQPDGQLGVSTPSLQPGMVLTRVGGESVLGASYSDVMQRLQQRPIRLTFADSLHKVMRHVTAGKACKAAAYARNVKAAAASGLTSLPTSALMALPGGGGGHSGASLATRTGHQGGEELSAEGVAAEFRARVEDAEQAVRDTEAALEEQRGAGYGKAADAELQLWLHELQQVRMPHDHTHPTESRHAATAAAVLAEAPDHGSWAQLAFELKEGLKPRPASAALAMSGIAALPPSSWAVTRASTAMELAAIPTLVGGLPREGDAPPPPQLSDRQPPQGTQRPQHPHPQQPPHRRPAAGPDDTPVPEPSPGIARLALVPLGDQRSSYPRPEPRPRAAGRASPRAGGAGGRGRDHGRYHGGDRLAAMVGVPGLEPPRPELSPAAQGQMGVNGAGGAGGAGQRVSKQHMASKVRAELAAKTRAAHEQWCDASPPPSTCGALTAKIPSLSGLEALLMSTTHDELTNSIVIIVRGVPSAWQGEGGCPAAGAVGGGHLTRPSAAALRRPGAAAAAARVLRGARQAQARRRDRGAVGCGGRCVLFGGRFD